MSVTRYGKHACPGTLPRVPLTHCVIFRSGGILQEVRHLPDKHVCFVSFVMPESALALYQFALANGLTIKNRRLKIGWGKNTGPCPPGIAAIVAAGGSRNVYIGNVRP